MGSSSERPEGPVITPACNLSVESFEPSRLPTIRDASAIYTGYLTLRRPGALALTLPHKLVTGSRDSQGLKENKELRRERPVVVVVES
jgi:hypothetical protein